VLARWRQRRLFKARERLGADFYGGWNPEDARFFQEFAVKATPRENAVTNFLGIHYDIQYVPWMSNSASKVFGLPIPSDSIHHDAIEYFALLKSFKSAGQCFSVVELGAQYGPWVCAAAVLGARLGKPTKLVAVEASPVLAALIPLHLSFNSIDPNHARVIQGAVSDKRGTCYFPKVNSLRENGGQIAYQPTDVDYIGRKVQYETVPAYELADVLPEGLIDFLHVDIQGLETAVLSNPVMNERVRAVFVGTHSRKIEGELIEIFHSNGWELKRERPTKFLYRAELPNIVGWTSKDGGQYWTNPRLSNGS
jgi:FkbM family methyltransferase